MKKILLIAAFVGLLFASCEKVIDINPTDTKPKVVMISNVEEGNEITARISLSRFFLDSHPFSVIDNADFQLTVNGAPLSILTEGDDGIYTLHYTPQEGDHLAIRVLAPGRDTVSASTYIPLHANATNFRAFHYDEDNYRYCLSFDLIDDPNETNYYALSVNSQMVAYRTLNYEDGTVGYDTVSVVTDAYFSTTTQELRDMSSLEDLIEGIDNEAVYSELLFHDSFIQGRTLHINLECSTDYLPYWSFYDAPYSEEHGYPQVRVDSLIMRPQVVIRTLTRDRYLYELTLDAYDYDEILAMFSEQVDIHCNIRGGIGIFAGSTTTKYSLDITQ